MMQIIPTTVLLLAVASLGWAQLPYQAGAGQPQQQQQLQQITLQQLLASNGLANKQGITLFLIAPQKMIRTTALGNSAAYGSAATAAATGRTLGGAGDAYGASNNYETVQSVQEVNYNAPATPVRVNYQSQSAPLDVQHTHIPAPKPELKQTRSEEEPHVLIHEIIRPVVQEIREIITPYRRIVQEIRPVQESVVQNIHKRGQTGASSQTVASKPSKAQQQY